MNSVKKKKGFTLPELLASIVVLGIILSIAIVSIQSVIRKSHKTYDEEQLHLFVSAAKSYFNDNKSKLPQVLMNSESVDLATLKENNYIDNVVDSKKVSCDVNKSKVTVTRYAAGKYSYNGILYCGNNVIGKEKLNKSSIMTSTFLEYKYAKNMDVVYNTNDSIYYTNDKVTVDVELTGDNGMAAYKYIIYKNDKKFKEGEAKSLINVDKSFTDSITISKDTFSDGKYRIETIAYDKAGNSLTEESSIIWLDTKAPTCNIKFDGTIGENGWYKEKNVNVSVDIINGGKTPTDIIGKGLSTSSITLYNNINNEIQSNTTVNGVNWYGYVKDKAGNEGSCLANVKVDTTAPECNVAINKLESGEYKQSGNWYNKNVSLIQTCSDSLSGCTNEIAASKTLSATVGSQSFDYLSSITVKDNAGNTGICDAISAGVDKKGPSCTYSGQNTSWTNSNINITLGCNDNSGAGCNIVNSSKPYSTTTKTANYPSTIISDKVGNSTTCNDTVNVYVDKTAPTCGTVTASKSVNSWIKKGETVLLNGTLTDSDSGVDYWNWYTNYDDTQQGNWHFYSKHSTSAVAAEFIGNNSDGMTNAFGKIIVYDKAGNPKECTYGPYKSDKTPPVINHSAFDDYSEKLNDKYYNSNTRTVWCTDGGSGVKSGTFGVDLIQNGSFEISEYDGPKGKITYTNSDNTSLKFYYSTSGVKNTYAVCQDKAGNSIKEQIVDHDVCCVCRSTSQGTSPGNARIFAGTSHYCGNKVYDDYGVLQNKTRGNSDSTPPQYNFGGEGYDMFLSCGKCDNSTQYRLSK